MTNKTPVSLTAADFDAVVGAETRPVLVDFHATWCGPCQTLAPIVDQLAADFAGRAVVAKVNIDDAPDLAARYGVRAVPTLLFLRGGEEIDRITGLARKHDIAGRLESLEGAVQ